MMRLFFNYQSSMSTYLESQHFKKLRRERLKCHYHYTYSEVVFTLNITCLHVVYTIYNI